jgi:hypothetical protein
MRKKKRPACLRRVALYIFLFLLYVNTTSVRCRNNHHHHNNYCSYYGNDVIYSAFQHKVNVRNKYTPAMSKKELQQATFLFEV